VDPCYCVTTLGVSFESDSAQRPTEPSRIGILVSATPRYTDIGTLGTIRWPLMRQAPYAAGSQDSKGTAAQVTWNFIAAANNPEAGPCIADELTDSALVPNMPYHIHKGEFTGAGNERDSSSIQQR
jgi:hypothetical protein